MESKQDLCLSGLQQATEAWLQSLPPSLLEPQDGLLLLDVNVLELATSQAHRRLGYALLESPGANMGRICGVPAPNRPKCTHIERLACPETRFQEPFDQCTAPPPCARRARLFSALPPQSEYGRQC